MKIILDTNFLIDCIRFKIDIESELMGNEILVLESIVSEIKRITKRGTKESSLAKIAFDYIKRKGLKVLKSKEKDTDASLLKYSKKGYAIATQDRILKDKLKKEGGKVIYIRQKKYVVFE